MAGSRKLGRTSDHRQAMLRAMVTFLLENGKIETTVTRAKEVRAMAEKMITLGKNNNLHSKRRSCEKVIRRNRPEIRRCKRWLLPDRKNRPAPRRRSRNGCHRVGLIP